MARKIVRVWFPLVLSSLLAGVGACASAPAPPRIVLTVKPPAALGRRVDGVRAHLETNDPLRLEVRYGEHTWNPVCDAPCDARVPAHATYRIARSRHAVSEEFELDVPHGAVVTIAVGPTQDYDDTPGTPLFNPGF